jgi:hypothetical protein
MQWRRASKELKPFGGVPADNSNQQASRMMYPISTLPAANGEGGD